MKKIFNVTKYKDNINKQYKTNVLLSGLRRQVKPNGTSQAEDSVFGLYIGNLYDDFQMAVFLDTNQDSHFFCL